MISAYKQAPPLPTPAQRRKFASKDFSLGVSAKTKVFTTKTRHLTRMGSPQTPSVSGEIFLYAKGNKPVDSR